MPLDPSVFLHAGLLIVLLSGVPLGAAFFIGLGIGVIQAATQIQEQTLSAVPKLGALAAIVFFGGAWAMNELVDLFRVLLELAAGS